MASKKLEKSKGNFQRIPSGIPGLDKLIEGGFIKGSTILVSGGAGTGKTIFCAQFIMEGLKRGENCMFITLEEKESDIIEDVRRFGWDFEKYIKEKKLFLEYQDPFQMTDITSPLIDKIKEHNVSRVAIDSTAVFGMYYKEPFEVRKQLFKLLGGLKEIGVTSVLTSELPEDKKSLARFGVEEFVVDGLIVLDYDILRPNPLQLVVRKMRRTKHYRKSVLMDITDEGIVLKPPETK
ncbi:MAG: ATPase domain-containing protein [Candidatus Aenigmatarchaeota archaeon]